MNASRPIIRTALPRAARSARIARSNRQIRFQSTAPSSSSTASSGSSPLTAGIIGGLIGAGTLYGIYYVTPSGQVSRKINKAAYEADKKYKEAAQKLQQATPNADQAIDAVRQYAYSYAGWVPGGRAYVDTIFNDFDTVREKHRDEADQLVNEAYGKLRDISKSGLSMETLQKGYEALADLAKKVADLAGDAISDVIDNHPQLKEQLGGKVDTLKQLGEQYGPEAKKQVDDTWKQIKQIMTGGFSAASLAKAKALVDEKTEQLKKFGDEAWSKGLEQAQPLLEKNPKIKELIEKNSDALKQGNIGELWEQVKSAAGSDDLGSLEEYVTQAANKAKDQGSKIAEGTGLEKYLKMLPQGDEILPKLRQLSEVANKHKEEGEKLLKETVEELKKVLEEKAKRAEEIAGNAKKDAKDTKDSKNTKDSKDSKDSKDNKGSKDSK